MAVGFSGSNGGISEAYNRVMSKDVLAGINKYKSLLGTISEGAKPLYQQAVDDLTSLYKKIGGLDKKVEDGYRH